MNYFRLPSALFTRGEVLIELVKFLFFSFVMAALDTFNLNVLSEHDNRVNAKKTLCSTGFLQILGLRQLKLSYRSTSIIDLLLPR